MLQKTAHHPNVRSHGRQHERPLLNKVTSVVTLQLINASTEHWPRKGNGEALSQVIKQLCHCLLIAGAGPNPLPPCLEKTTSLLFVDKL
jgi:hypothetical protein